MLKICFGLLALIHALPAVAALAPSRLVALYNLAPDDATTLTLLQHRAVLFGLLSAGSVLAIFRPDARGPVLAALLISMASFAVMALLHSTATTSLSKIFYADLLGLLIGSIALVILLKG